MTNLISDHHIFMKLPGRIFRFYRDGFKSMTIGRTLWLVIILKLILILAVMKLFFFPDVLKTGYDNDKERAEAVRSVMQGRR